MDKKNLEILGLSEGATLEDIKSAYEALRTKYLEERFMDGEVGNNAATMLTKIQVAYEELTREINESAYTKGDSGDSYKRVEELLKDGNIQEAQRLLDNFNERTAHWHYLQSVVFYRKNWMNESKKQLEIAIQLDPNNSKYKDSYRKLNEKLERDKNEMGQNANGNPNEGVYRGQTMDEYGDDSQMGGNFCASCIECMCINMCVNMFCNSCCR
ncbi:MAG: J domain-containing protein [Clostridiales bacterium]|nr:J domain-containing protein [Clostridiales bacterium]